MPTSIPYDPSLALMDVVHAAALKNVEEISKVQEPVDTAQDALNSLISSKRGLTMTKTELKNLGIGTEALDAELNKLNAAIERAMTDYAAAKKTAEPQIMSLRENIRSVHSSIESPVDYLRSEIKTMPLAADTMNMDVHYFSFDSNSQSAAAYSAQVGAYISGGVSSVFGPSTSMEIGISASRQVSRQTGSHSIEGTLVLSVSCTHKNASIVAPFIMHIDKAIKVWNDLFPEKKLDPTAGTSMMKCAMNESQEDKEKFSIISGTTFGSSFVGMVHVLKTAGSSASETLEAAAASLQRTMDTGAWFAKSEGKVGVDAKFASDIKNLLSGQNIQSHVTWLSMGVIPSTINNATESAQSSVQNIAELSRTAGQPTAIHGESSKSAISAIVEVEDAKNQILDVNAMITALNDYLKKAAEGQGGIPINYWLKDIDQKMLAQMWAAKYYPGKFMSIKSDDSEGGGPAAEEKAKL